PDTTRPMPAVERPRAQPARKGEKRPRRFRRRALVPLALLGLLAAIAIVVLAAGGDDEPDRADRTGTTSTTAREKGPARAASGPPTPEAAVRSFYERAAEGDLAGSWRLAGPRMRAAFGNSLPTFKGDLGSLRAITFHALKQTETTSRTATVSLETTAEHTDRTERCTGTVQTVKSRKGRWLVEPHGVRCVAV
ncbi:MAG TPA: hypothetical protein VGV67_02045, partial [Solirubrobacteraceae bacterium]|nr:hypothetical protein [Solirubrobacteraceae bacterium]